MSESSKASSSCGFGNGVEHYERPPHQLSGSSSGSIPRAAKASTPAPKRAAQLAQRGLVVRAHEAEIRMPVKTLQIRQRNTPNRCRLGIRYACAENRPAT
jgi:hypothetical protein